MKTDYACYALRFFSLSERMKLKIIYEFYWKKRSKVYISEDLFMPYSTVCRVIRDYDSYPREFGKMFENHVNISVWPQVKSK